MHNSVTHKYYFKTKSDNLNGTVSKSVYVMSNDTQSECCMVIPM